MTPPDDLAARRPLASPLRGVRAAFVFFTRIPVGGQPCTPEDFRWAAAHFPFIGACLGVAAAGVVVLAAPLGRLVAAVLAVASTAALSGALHEDGLADTFDALGGSHGTDRIFEILRDSRIGTFGVLALALSLLFRIAALAELGWATPAALVLAHAAARTGPVWLMTVLPYVSAPHAKSSLVVQGGRWPQAVVATTWMLLSCLASARLGLPHTAVMLGTLAMTAVTLMTGAWYRARAGGLTGDFLGATEQIGEVAVLVVVLAAIRGHL